MFFLFTASLLKTWKNRYSTTRLGALNHWVLHHHFILKSLNIVWDKKVFWKIKNAFILNCYSIFRIGVSRVLFFWTKLILHFWFIIYFLIIMILNYFIRTFMAFFIIRINSVRKKHLFFLLALRTAQPHLWTRLN